MKFFKYHALGNDYLVIDPQDWPSPLTPSQIKLICHRNFGVGSDGILLGPLPSDQARFALRVFNPDGSEAEKSGNGLRIFSRYLWDRQLVKDEEFAIQTQGPIGTGPVEVPSIAYVVPAAFWWIILQGYLLIEEQITVARTSSTAVGAAAGE